MPKSIDLLTAAATHAHKAFRKINLSYVIVGGAAANFHGYFRETNDVDINVGHISDENELGAVLSEEGYNLKAGERGFVAKPQGGALSTGLPKLDVKTPSPDAWRLILAHSMQTDSGLCIADNECLIVMKILAVATKGKKTEKKLANDFMDMKLAMDSLIRNHSVIDNQLQLAILRQQNLKGPFSWEKFWERVQNHSPFDKNGLQALLDRVGVVSE